MGKAWHVRMMTDVVTQVGVLAMRGWVLKDPAIHFWEYRARNHVCGKECGGYRVENEEDGKGRGRA